MSGWVFFTSCHVGVIYLTDPKELLSELKILPHELNAARAARPGGLLFLIDSHPSRCFLSAQRLEKNNVLVNKSLIINYQMKLMTIIKGSEVRGGVIYLMNKLTCLLSLDNK